MTISAIRSGDRARWLRALLASTILVGCGALSASAQEVDEDTDAAQTSADLAGSDAAADGTVELGGILITGSSYETEGSDSYTTELISVGEKEARPQREIPQSSTVVTNERIEDSDYTSLDTALRETPGVVVLDNDNGRSSLYSRGFEFDWLYFDGLLAPVSSIYGTQPDLAIVDHIEILRGPSGLFTATGEPAGAINMHLKEPMDEFHASLEASYGSWATKRTTADVTGPLNEAGTIRGRMIGVWQDGDGWVDGVENGVWDGYGTLEVDLTESTTARFTVNHMERDISPFNGLPAYSDGSLLDVDRSTSASPDWNDFDNSVTDYLAEIEHQFADGGHARVAARYSERDADFLYGWAGSAVDEDGNFSNVRYLARDFHETSLALDAFVSRPFTLFGQEHNILVGTDYQKVETTVKSASGVISGSYNIYDWDSSSVDRPDYDYTSQTETDLEQLGIYGQLRVKPIDRWTLIGGGRVSWYDSSSTNLLTDTESDEVDINGHITPYAGTVFDLTDQISAYASYTEIFQPQTNVDEDGNILDPREGRQYEVGLKGAFFGGTLNTSAALFNLRDKNRALADDDGNYHASGEVEAQGVELEVSGEVLPNWQIQAGYTYTESEYLNGDDQGEIFSTYTPEHMFQLWTNYTFRQPDEWWDGLSVGGGVKVFSEFSSVAQGITIEAPGYTVVDLRLGYQINEHLSAQLNVNNLFDEKYYTRVGSTSVFNFYGEPRSAMVTVKAEF
ncbi:TonB-dependent siderophore receptor [Consotaella aegiceratis]|uniref:TonB-dependent siderophore receptor n=1 Tax=Consotaella aegiceratis TaxID=3097961 RepID=UPI002F40AC86